ncbi:hypothetical protein QOZ80_5BG0454020 [Eleusine coracana subsp. coracana]|nr:hypothetical protein QOZ80_5BG0454020 [Eleusine coracana subsp. coracana]
MGSMGFPVTRTNRSLVAPSSATPRETLRLSVIDRVEGLRHLVRSLHVFDAGGGAAMAGDNKTPARTMREALGKALVDYYPFAGRFVVEAADGGGEVRVACTAEGAWFVEASAACSLAEVKHLDHPMLIPKEDLLPEPNPDVPPLDMPLMMQVCYGSTTSSHAAAAVTPNSFYYQYCYYYCCYSAIFLHA